MASRAAGPHIVDMYLGVLITDLTASYNCQDIYGSF